YADFIAIAVAAERNQHGVRGRRKPRFDLFECHDRLAIVQVRAAVREIHRKRRDFVIAVMGHNIRNQACERGCAEDDKGVRHVSSNHQPGERSAKDRREASASSARRTGHRAYAVWHLNMGGDAFDSLGPVLVEDVCLACGKICGSYVLEWVAKDIFDHVAYTVCTVQSECAVKRQAEHLLRNGVGHGEAFRVGTRQRLVMRVLAAEGTKVASGKYFEPFQRLAQRVAGHTDLTLSDPDYEILVA